jgi:FKBP-type peptidyl-prolyl cis-trans isomerase FklB
MRLLLFIASLAGAFATNAAGIAFLDANKAKEGVVTLPSGLQYKVLEKGTGSDHPAVSSPCECHYEGRTAAQYPSGPKFDSSYDRGSPTTFAPNQVIKGWTEAMQLMVEGDKWELYIPSDLAYGDRGRPPKIGGGDCLVFTIELLKIKGARVAAAKDEP